MEHNNSSNMPEKRRWSAGKIVFLFFLFAIGYTLTMEHWAHVVPYLPWLILLLCPVMHLFHHGGHGGHASHDHNHHDNKEE